MVPVVKLVQTDTKDRYPRWGYLDKFGTNDHMARACALTVALHLVGLLGYAGWQWSRPEPTLEVARDDTLPIVGPGAMPMPPPLRISDRTVQIKPPPKVPPSRPAQSKPVPVAEDPALDALEVGDVVGADDPADGPQGSRGPFVNDMTWIETRAPAAEIFIVVEVEPVLVDMQTPTYPELARDAGVEGDVVVRVLVGRDGRVRDALIVRSVAMLDAAALEAAHSAVFKPALQAGQPIAVWVMMPISFTLRR